MTTIQSVEDTWRTMDWPDATMDLWLKKELLKVLIEIRDVLHYQVKP